MVDEASGDHDTTGALNCTPITRPAARIAVGASLDPVPVARLQVILEYDPAIGVQNLIAGPPCVCEVPPGFLKMACQSVGSGEALVGIGQIEV